MSNQHSSRETSEGARRQRSLLLIPLAIIGLAFGLWFINLEDDLAQSRVEIWDQSLTWPTVSGVVIDSYADTYQKFDQDGDYIMYYFARVEYEYSVDGTNYSSSNLDFRAHMSTFAGAADALVNQYPAGIKVEVYYNPSKPDVSVLIPGCQGCGRNPSDSSLLLGGGLILVCLLFLIYQLTYVSGEFISWVKRIVSS